MEDVVRSVTTLLAHSFVDAMKDTFSTMIMSTVMVCTFTTTTGAYRQNNIIEVDFLHRY